MGGAAYLRADGGWGVGHLADQQTQEEVVQSGGVAVAGQEEEQLGKTRHLGHLHAHFTPRLRASRRTNVETCCQKTNRAINTGHIVNQTIPKR